jgi:crotonobetainyl-CoA:carnitine CoA-transferase CaiB-like acyl-CoA transferase
VRRLLKQLTKAQVIARLDGSGLPFAPIGRPEDMFDDPHLLASGGLEDVTLDDGRMTQLPALPIEMEGARVGGSVALPVPGADTDTILADLGFDATDIADLRAKGAVG